MSDFIDYAASLDATWRAIILFGRNSASYKFALGKALLDLAAQQKTFVTLDELAMPYSNYLLDHLRKTDKQGIASSSQFLDAGRNYLAGTISHDQFIEQTVRLGFVNVIDAFHVVNNQDVPTRFYQDERQQRNGIVLTDSLFEMLETTQAPNLPYEVEARWCLVETAWSINISPALLMVEHQMDNELLVVQTEAQRRINVTSSRDALNGYQKGHCFYCFADLSLDPASDNLTHVDHFFPHVLMQVNPPEGINLNGIWNLVLSCSACNAGVGGKFARVPQVKYLQRLNKRNNYLIDSHHPLRETLRNQTGQTAADRQTFLQAIDQWAIEKLIHRWEPPNEFPALF